MLNSRDSFQKLQAHHRALSGRRVADFFADDPARFNDFHARINGMLFDYSKHPVTRDTLTLLMDLARECRLAEKRDAMFGGEVINESEGRAVLHAALRGSMASDLVVEGENVQDFVQDTLKQMREISDHIRDNPDITDVVNIGIGGSDLGPRLAYEALLPFCDGPRVHFIANIDGHRISELLSQLEPKNTVFIVASKTFTTQETLLNAKTARGWILDALGEDAIPNHFYAISTNIEAATTFGVDQNNILPMRDWVGGRFSVWGAIGLPLCIAIGFENFQAFLDGAKRMDTHFQTAELEKNIPVLMAMLGIWYHNICGYPAHAVIPYAQTLTNFPRYLQQVDMESNGKSVNTADAFIDYQTAPITFGEPGTNAQHAFFQLFHQGTQIVPIDFIAILNPEHDLKAHHQKLLANALAQSQALMVGDPNPDTPHQHFEGNRPNSMIFLERLDPYHLGMLLALYEHKVFVQGVIWGINSFDQWGVELGKKLANQIEAALDDDSVLEVADPSTQNLMRHILEKRS